MTRNETWISDPGAITRESFRRLDEMLSPYAISPGIYPVVRRVVHASADFDFATGLRFHPEALSAGLAALRAGARIFCDTRMVAAGINKEALARLKCPLDCRIDDPGVTEVARLSGETRAMVAVRQAAPDLDGSILVIGNAPTALYEALRLSEVTVLNPALIIGIPVGFVGTLESKRLLMAQEIPYITNETYKGGSAVAAAIVNALLFLALEGQP